MRTAIIGPGRLGTLLAVACARAGHRVVAVAGGSEASRAAVTSRVAGVRSHASPVEAVARAELVLLTVPDDHIAAVVTGLVAEDALHSGHRIVHTSGATGPELLARAALAGARTAACHPAMTVPTGTTDPEVLVGVPWAVTCAEADRSWAHGLVRDLGGDPHEVPADRRALYHAALTVGSNAVAAAVATARQLLLAAAVDDPAAFLRPLATASVEAVSTGGAAAITGPLVRGDISTISRHLDAIEADVPVLAEGYRLLSRAILERLRPELDPSTVQLLTARLAPPPKEDRPCDA